MTASSIAQIPPYSQDQKKNCKKDDPVPKGPLKKIREATWKCLEDIANDSEILRKKIKANRAKELGKPENEILYVQLTPMENTEMQLIFWRSVFSNCCTIL